MEKQHINIKWEKNHSLTFSRQVQNIQKAKPDVETKWYWDGVKNDRHGLWPAMTEVEKLSTLMLSCGLKSLWSLYWQLKLNVNGHCLCQLNNLRQLHSLKETSQHNVMQTSIYTVNKASKHRSLFVKAEYNSTMVTENNEQHAFYRLGLRVQKFPAENFRIFIPIFL